MPPVGFEPTISAGVRSKTYALTTRPLGPALEAFILFDFAAAVVTDYKYNRTLILG